MRSLGVGGSVFVGKLLVIALVEAGHEVTVFNRGLTHTTLPADVRHLVADRTDVTSMRAALGAQQWDAVFDVLAIIGTALHHTFLRRLVDIIR